jgi:hypothetical protein
VDRPRPEGFPSFTIKDTTGRTHKINVKTYLEYNNFSYYAEILVKHLNLDFTKDFEKFKRQLLTYRLAYLDLPPENVHETTTSSTSDSTRRVTTLSPQETNKELQYQQQQDANDQAWANCWPQSQFLREMFTVQWMLDTENRNHENAFEAFKRTLEYPNYCRAKEAYDKLNPQ